jgi:glycosyltransferase involved in cell wall biosynthesis
MESVFLDKLKMRLLFLSNFYPPYEIGGYEQWCQEVATCLMNRGHEIAVLTSRYGAQKTSKNGTQQVTRTLYLQADIAYYRPIDFFLRRPCQDRANNRALRKKIAQFRPDIVMVWGMWNLSHSLPYWAEQWMSGRVAYFISNYWPIDTDPHTAYWRLPTRRPILELIKRPLRALALSKLRMERYPPQLRFEHAVCCSEYVRNNLVNVGRLPSGAGVLLGGIDPEPFLKISRLGKNNSHEQNGPLQLLYFGRLIYDKGVHTAMEAMGLLKQRGLAKGIQMTILGSGHPDYEAKLRRMLDQLDIGDKVRFVRQVPRKEVPEWLRRFDVYLFTSIWPEPMARSVMEAMAAGLLVIGTEVGGQAEMLAHGQNALTFKAQDVECLASHIARVSNDPLLRLRLARAGQQMVLERFTLERMVNEIEEYLFHIIQTTPARAS